ncbi:MAG: PP2C family serine/threonine-protein phosphatase [Tepidisphaerales bacterium]
MWKIVRCVSTGREKPPTKTVCQDALHVMKFERPESVLVACCADGAGSATLGDVGAKLACRQTGKAAERFIKSAGKAGLAEPPGRAVVEGWLESARRSLEAKAAERCVPLRELATTLVLAVATERWVLVGQVGDGAAVFDAEGPRGSYEVPLWPDNGEYANCTSFLTGESWRRDLRCVAARRRIREMAMFTDGLQRLALHYAARRPHPPFFERFFEKLRAMKETDRLRPALATFLTSPAVKSHTDDDLTLVLACRDDEDPHAHR